MVGTQIIAVLVVCSSISSTEMAGEQKNRINSKWRGLKCCENQNSQVHLISLKKHVWYRRLEGNGVFSKNWFLFNMRINFKCNFKTIFSWESFENRQCRRFEIRLLEGATWNLQSMGSGPRFPENGLGRNDVEFVSNSCNVKTQPWWFRGQWITDFGGIKQCKCMINLWNFPFPTALFGLVI